MRAPVPANARLAACADPYKLPGMDGSNSGTPRLSTTELLSRLVSYDTTSRNSNLELIGYIRSYLDAHGVPYRISTDATGAKANIHAIIGPQQAGGVALSGHVDTVPVDGQAWSADPFCLRRADGRLYARGSADMKGFVSACLAAVPDFVSKKLARPLHLFISYDEEVGCQGAQRLIEDLDVSGLKPALCVVGEPSGMQPILAHKGKLNLRVSVRGLPGHSSDPAKGVNAIQAAGEAIAYVAGEARRLSREGPFEDGFDPPHTTIHVGTIHGGTILNIIPERCEFIMEWRNIPGDDPERHLERMRDFVARTIEPAMHAVNPNTGFDFEVTTRMPGLSLDPDHPLTDVVKQLTGSNSTGKVSYGTEGGYYQNVDIPTIICGPGHIAQAHQPDEWIAQDQLDACDAFIRRLADRLLV
jgi:acetylornithine deacetylase